MNHLYKRFYKHQWKAIVFLWAAFSQTFTKAVVDIVVKHWLITLAFIALSVYAIVTVGNARAERDRLLEENYMLETKMNMFSIKK